MDFSIMMKFKILLVNKYAYSLVQYFLHIASVTYYFSIFLVLSPLMLQIFHDLHLKSEFNSFLIFLTVFISNLIKIINI